MNRFGWRAAIVAVAGLAVSGLAGLSVAQDVSNRTGPSDQPAGAVSTPPAVVPASQLPTSAAPPEEESAPPTPAETTAAANTAEDDTDDQGPPPPPAKPPEPLKRPRFTSAVIQTLDKVTAKTLRFEAKVNEPVRYGDLVLTVHACEGTAPDEDYPDSVAHMEVVSQPQQLPGQPAPQVRQLFRGWMFASSPGLHPFQSPGYDLWLIACKTDAPASAVPGGAIGSR